MGILWIDCETFNTENIRTVGTGRYVETCELMLVTWALDNGPVHTWDLMMGECDGDLAADCAQATQFRAANAPFDRPVLSTRVTCIPHDPAMWSCLVVRAYRAGWPLAKLEYLCDQLGLGSDVAKVKDGKRLIQMFCKPRKPTKKLKMTRYTHEHKPVEWEAFAEYARSDVRALRAAWDRLPGMNDTPLEAALWNLDQDINERGWPLDMVTVENANRLVEEEKANINKRLVQITNGRIAKVTDVETIRQFICEHLCEEPFAPRERLDTFMPTLDAEAIEHLLARDDIPYVVRQVAECRQEGARTTNAKYKAMAVAKNSDNRVRFTLQYGGAPRTLRWSGRKVQFHNLIRPGSPGLAHDGKPIKPWDARDIAQLIHDGITVEQLRSMFNSTPLEMIAYGIRGSIEAPEGKHLVTGDLSQIEARGVNWLAGNQRMLDVFADPDQDPYVYAANKVGSNDRQLGKVQTLSCGYGIGGDGYIDIANKPPYNMGLDSLTGERHVKDWRDANPEVVSFWYDLNDACIRAIENGTTEVCRRLTVSCWVHADIKYLGILLPSGRWLAFPHAQLRLRYGRKSIVYLSEFGLRDTHGGPLVGMATQSTARDIIGYGMLRAAAAGFKLIGHVHDELIAEVDDDDDVHTPELMNHCLVQLEPWMRGLPLTSDCAKTKRYKK